MRTPERAELGERVVVGGVTRRVLDRVASPHDGCIVLGEGHQRVVHDGHDATAASPRRRAASSALPRPTTRSGAQTASAASRLEPAHLGALAGRRRELGRRGLDEPAAVVVAVPPGGVVRRDVDEHRRLEVHRDDAGLLGELAERGVGGVLARVHVAARLEPDPEPPVAVQHHAERATPRTPTQ